MISAIGWIRREAVAAEPTRYRLNAADYATFMAQADAQIAAVHEEAEQSGIDLKTQLQAQQKQKARRNRDAMQVDSAEAEAVDDDEDLSKYNLDAYDEEDAAAGSAADSAMEEDGGREWDGLFTPVEKLLSMPSREELEAFALNGQDQEEEDAFDAEDLEDLRVQASDLLLVSAKTEDELSQLEVHIYEPHVAAVDPATGKDGAEDNMYVHHDLMVPSFPLCLEWLSFPVAQKAGANYVAVGSMDPVIEVWDLDVIDTVYPSITLGSRARGPAPPLAHTDAVMSLSWNRQTRNLLLSGGADAQCLLWDLARGTQATAFRAFGQHTGKVQTLQWNPAEAPLFASAAYDATAVVVDARAPGQAVRFAGAGVFSGDVEALRWMPNGSTFAVSDEGGRVVFFDLRCPAAPLLVLDAHSRAITCLDFCPIVREDGAALMLTGSTDKSLKLWALTPSATGLAPACLQTREMAAGKLFAAGFFPDDPLIVVAGGSRGNLNTWNLKREQVVVDFFMLGTKN